MRHEAQRHERVYTLGLTDRDLVSATLHEFDRALLADCEGSGSIADKLLALELLVRRAEGVNP